MKKNIFISMLLVVILILCSISEVSSTEQYPLVLKWYFAGSNPGGAGGWDMIGIGLSDIIMRSIPGSVVTVIPAEGFSTPIMVSNKEAELALGSSLSAEAASRGTEPYDKVYPNIATVCFLYANALQIVVNTEFEIESLADIKENEIPIRLSVGGPGSGSERDMLRIFKFLGFSYEDIESWGGKVVYKDMSEAASMLGDNLIDAFVLQTVVPAAALQEIEVRKDIKMLSLDDEVVQAMYEEYGIGRTVISKDSYDFLEKDILTTSNNIHLITNSLLPEEEIYHVTRSIVENIDYVHSIHSRLSGLTKEKLAEVGFPLHQGAEKYYKEQGLIK